MTERTVLVSRKDAQVRLGGISRSALYRMFDRGEITFTKVGRLTFIKDSEIERYLRAADRRRAA